MEERTFLVRHVATSCSSSVSDLSSFKPGCTVQTEITVFYMRALNQAKQTLQAHRMKKSQQKQR